MQSHTFYTAASKAKYYTASAYLQAHLLALSRGLCVIVQEVYSARVPHTFWIPRVFARLHPASIPQSVNIWPKPGVLVNY